MFTHLLILIRECSHTERKTQALCCYYYKQQAKLSVINHGRSQNLKEIPQNFKEVFNADDATDSDVIQRNQHREEKK